MRAIALGKTHIVLLAHCLSPLKKAHRTIVCGISSTRVLVVDLPSPTMVFLIVHREDHEFISVTVKCSPHEVCKVHIFFSLDSVNEKGDQPNRIGLFASFSGRCKCYNSG